MDPTQIQRILPMILAGGGTMVATQAGAKTFQRITNVVKTVVTRFEMAGIAKALEAEMLAGGLPDLDSDDAVAEFINENVDGKYGRDPSDDLWGNPYMIEQGRDGTVVLRSMGPNGQEDDDCSSYEGDEGAIMEVLDTVENTTEENDALYEYGEGLDEELAKDDDICLGLRFANSKGMYKQL